MGEVWDYQNDWAEDDETRNHFIYRVYTILSIQLMFTGAVIAMVQFVEEIKEYFYDRPFLLYIFMFVGMAAYLVIVCCSSVRRRFPINLILLIVMTICFAFMAAFISATYDIIIVLYAVIMTTVIVLVITFIAKCTSFDITSYAVVLMVLGMVFVVFALITTVVMIFAPIPLLHLIFSACAVALFTLYLLFDTQQIIGGGRIELDPDEYILGAIQLYIDIYQIFINLLVILSALFGDND